MAATHNIETVSFEGNFICLKVDGNFIKLPLDQISEKLVLANDLQRNLFKISQVDMVFIGLCWMKIYR